MLVWRYFVPPPNPVQGKMIHGSGQFRKKKFAFIHESAQTLVETMEGQNLKVMFFFCQGGAVFSMLP